MEKNNDVPKVGVIGVGTMGRHHARIASQTEGVILTGIYDPDESRAREIARLHGSHVFTALDELLEESRAVIVAAPTSAHLAIGEKCLRKGIDVMMEKPLAHSYDAARQLVLASNESGAILMAGHVERYNPAISKLIEALKDRQERIVSIDARRLAPFDGTRCIDVDVLYDLLIHDVDVVLELADSPIKSISALGRPVFSKQTDVVHVQMEFENGIIAVFWVGKCSPKKVRQLTVTTPSRFLQADTLLKSLTVCIAEQLPEMDNGICLMGTAKEENVEVSDDEPLRRELADFFNAVRTREKPVVNSERALRSMEALEMISARLSRTAGH